LVRLRCRLFLHDISQQPAISLCISFKLCAFLTLFNISFIVVDSISTFFTISSVAASNSSQNFSFSDLPPFAFAGVFFSFGGAFSFAGVAFFSFGDFGVGFAFLAGGGVGSFSLSYNNITYYILLVIITLPTTSASSSDSFSSSDSLLAFSLSEPFSSPLSLSSLSSSSSSSLSSASSDFSVFFVAFLLDVDRFFDALFLPIYLNFML
jgi:hypothetical protein